MPTENRSSNTEQMVSELLPCPFCKAAMHIESNRDWHRVMGEHDEECVFLDPETMMVPATDEQRELLVRDWNRRKKSAAQYQGEPVAQVVSKYGDPEAFGEREIQVLADLSSIPYDTKLYTHPAPPVQHQREPVALKCWSCKADFTLKERADCDECCWKCGAEIELDDYVEKYASEVGRLNCEVSKWRGTAGRLIHERDTLHAKLAERDALLRDINKRHSSGVDFDLPAYLAARVAAVCATSAEPSARRTTTPNPECALCKDLGDECMACETLRLREAWPWAEPSTPVELNEREEFEADQLSKGFAIDLLPGTAGIYMVPSVRFAWAGWQARTALERKP